MARPPRIDRPVEKNISLPTSIVVQVDLMLYSELEEKVPFGAWQKYILGLIQDDLAKKANASKQIGG